MEKTTIMIEIKQEVSVTLLWLVAGVVIVTVAYFLPGFSTEFWPSLHSAGAAAFIYLFALLMYTTRKPLERKWKIVVWSVALFALGTSAYQSFQFENQAMSTRRNLFEIRDIIYKGVPISLIPPPLFKTLGAYHQQRSPKKENLKEIFLRFNPGAVVGANIHEPDWDSDPQVILVQVLENNRIELAGGVAMPGKIQLYEHFTLTEKGLTHDTIE
ncbi:MAG: hypothetical protein V1799_13135 [bacterium]